VFAYCVSWADKLYVELVEFIQTSWEYCVQEKFFRTSEYPEACQR